MNFNKKLFYSELEKMLNHPRAIYVFISIIAISAIAMCAIAYLHDTYNSFFEMKELAKMDVWVRVFGTVLILMVSMFILWPIYSSIHALICALSPAAAKKIEEGIQKDGESPVELKIDKEALKLLFSDSFSEKRFDAFYEALCKNQTSLKKCDIGKLAHHIMYNTTYYSTDKKYQKTRNYNQERNFTPYCKDFYSAVGIISSTYDRNYFDKSPLSTLELFRPIFEDEMKEMKSE